VRYFGKICLENDCRLFWVTISAFTSRDRDRGLLNYRILLISISRSQWPRGLRRRSAAARLLRLWVRIPPGAWMSVCCECCVLSGRGHCDELTTRPG